MKSKVAIVAANYYENITSDLVDGVKNNLNKSFDSSTYFVDGAWEIIYKINDLSVNESIDKFVAIGVIIKGDTDHYEYISKGVVDGLVNLTIKNNIYIANCVLNVLNMDQAIARTKGTKNKGIEAASALNNLFV
ncbi:6,7-dimethyl-8-ribityllumazine synthase [Acidimicrobiaceae bacterium]|nr:6,7-dimethyl-8-ribityllumazine synthase [Acidimicrobiaceae bacterium]